jgi:hypothetical protein
VSWLGAEDKHARLRRGTSNKQRSKLETLARSSTHHATIAPRGTHHATIAPRGTHHADGVGADNKRDFDELPAYISEGMTAHFVEHYSEVFHIVFAS